MAKRKKILSILFIPDGEQQTYTLKLRYGFVKTLAVFTTFFFAVLVLGAISYWQLAKIAIDYNRISAQNTKLLRDNELINDIARNYARTQSVESRILSVLGEKVDFNSRSGVGLANATANSADYSNPLYAQYSGRAGAATSQSDLLSSFPTAMPVDGPVSRNYIKKLEFTDSGHFGIDLVAPELSVVSAAGDGIVIFAGETLAGGHEVLLDHQNGYITLYKHNAAILVQPRQFVRQGEPVALLGNSGDSTAPHLHFEIWKEYKQIDPLTVLYRKPTE